MLSFGEQANSTLTAVRASSLQHVTQMSNKIFDTATTTSYQSRD